MPGQDASWRVRIGPANGHGPQTVQAAVAVLPPTESYVVDGALVLYTRSLEAAEAVLGAQDPGDILWTDISTWADGPEAWRSTQTTGDPGVTLYTWDIDDAGVARRKDRLGTHPLLIPVCLLCAAVLAFLVVYFIGGTPGSSVGDHTHNLAAAVTIALCVLVIPPFVVRARHRE